MSSADESRRRPSGTPRPSFPSSHLLKARWAPHLTAFSLLLLAIAGAYANVFDNPFAMDDAALIVEPTLDFEKGLEDNGIWWGIRKILRLPLDQPYRWVRLFTYYLDYLVWGGSLFGLHFTNLVCHLIASCFVYLSISSLTARKHLALLCALAFALHPIQTESVTYLSGRRDVLMGCLFFIAFYVSLRYEQRKRGSLLVGICLVYVLAVFTKEMAITLPGVIFLAFFARHFERERLPLWEQLSSTFRTILREKGSLLFPLFALCLFFFFLFTIFLNATLRESYYGGTLQLNFLTVAKVWVYYVYLLILPLQLIADYTNFMTVISSVGDPLALLAAVAVACLALAMVWLFLNRHTWAAFGLAWFMITLLPVSHIIPHHELMAEHYLYVPAFGFLFFLISLLDMAIDHRPKLLVIILLPLLLLAGVRTFIRNEDWDDEYILYGKTASQVPENPRAHMNFGVILLERGEIDEALLHLARATALHPELAKPHFNLGRAYLIQGETETAILQFQTARRLDPGYPLADLYLGEALLQSERHEEAMRILQEATRRLPDMGESHRGLGIAFLRLAAYDKAISALKAALTLLPEDEKTFFYLGDAHGQRARARQNHEDLQQAAELFEQVIRLNPGNMPAFFQVGQIYALQKRYQKAIQNFEACIDNGYRVGESHYNMAFALYSMGNTMEATRHLELARSHGITVASSIEEEIRKQQTQDR